MNDIKVYVEVMTRTRTDGIMLPLSILWENGKEYFIDRVTDIRQAAAMKAGGQGDRYTVMINGQMSYLFFEWSTNLTGNTIGRWFVERKAA